MSDNSHLAAQRKKALRICILAGIAIVVGITWSLLNSEEETDVKKNPVANPSSKSGNPSQFSRTVDNVLGIPERVQNLNENRNQQIKDILSQTGIAGPKTTKSPPTTPIVEPTSTAEVTGNL